MPPGLQGRLVAQGPGGLVEAVHQLLGGLVAGEPVEVVPVLHLVLHFAPLGPAARGAHRACRRRSPGWPRSRRSRRRGRGSSLRERPGRSASTARRRGRAVSSAPPRRRPWPFSGPARPARAAFRRRRACRRPRRRVRCSGWKCEAAAHKHHVDAAVRSASRRRRSRGSNGRRRPPPARAYNFLSRPRAPCRRSSKMSAMATSRTSLPAFMALAAAPLPRPPQPIRPILITSLPAACAVRAHGQFARHGRRGGKGTLQKAAARMERIVVW